MLNDLTDRVLPWKRIASKVVMRGYGWIRRRDSPDAPWEWGIQLKIADGMGGFSADDGQILTTKQARTMAKQLNALCDQLERANGGGRG